MWEFKAKADPANLNEMSRYDRVDVCSVYAAPG
jgi:hypothetical protein